MNKKAGIILIILGIIIIIVSVLFVGEKKEKENLKPNNQEEKKREEVSLSDFDNSIMDQIPEIYNSTLDSSLFVYQDKKITVKDISTSWLYDIEIKHTTRDEITFCQIDENCTFKVDVDLLKERISEKYDNPNTTPPKETNVIMGKKCVLDNNKYKCSENNYDVINSNYLRYFTFYNDYNDLKEITKAEKDDSYLYVYQKYINIRLEDISNFDANNLDTIKLGLYKNSNTNEKITNTIFIGKDYYQEGAYDKFKDNIKTEYLEKAPLYLHTFKKLNNDKYIWISTELVK